MRLDAPRTLRRSGDGARRGRGDRRLTRAVASVVGFRLMAYDVYPHLPWDQGTDPFFVSVRGTDAEELQGYWDELSDGATVHQPLAPSQWAPLYGQLTDRFGVTWVLDIAAPHAEG